MLHYQKRPPALPRPIGTLDVLAAHMRRTGSPLTKTFQNGKVPAYAVGALACSPEVAERAIAGGFVRARDLGLFGDASTAQTFELRPPGLPRRPVR